jgi:DNA-binding LytR/AlgR family response regulator
MKKTAILFKAEKMIVEDKSGISQVDYKEIVGIFCDHPYLLLQTSDKKNKYLFHTIQEIIISMPDHFVMCNRSSLVNLSYFSSLETKKNQWYLHLKTGDIISITSKYRKVIKEKIKRFIQV